jgi:hypothetical protein
VRRDAGQNMSSFRGKRARVRILEPNACKVARDLVI